MDAVWKFIGEFVAAVGGVGFIIIGLSSYISKLWAERFMEKEKEKISKEIESYKHELQKEIEMTRVLNEQMSYRNKVIFDGEFQYYRDIVPKLINASDNIALYIAMKINFLQTQEENTEQMTGLIEKKKTLARDTLFEFHDILSIYAVFIDKEIYDEMSLFFIKALPLVVDKDENIIGGSVEALEDMLNECSARKLSIIDSLREKIRK